VGSSEKNASELEDEFEDISLVLNLLDLQSRLSEKTDSIER
jgi:hypothetical protein